MSLRKKKKQLLASAMALLMSVGGVSTLTAAAPGVLAADPSKGSITLDTSQYILAPGGNSQNPLLFCGYACVQFEPQALHRSAYHNKQLKSLTGYRFGKIKEWTQVKQSVSRLMCILFPELEQMVSTLHAASVYAPLKEKNFRVLSKSPLYI